MSSPYVKLGNRTLDQWKVTELKEELKRRRLTTSGLKQDLVRRLDEAVRFEMGSSMDNAEDDATQSAVSIEKENAGTNISDRFENIKDGDIDIVEKLEPKFGNAVDYSTGASMKGKFNEADLEGTKATGLEQDQVPEPFWLGTTEVNDTIEPAKPVKRKNEDGHPQKDAKIELYGPSTQSSQISESSSPVAPYNTLDLHVSGTQNEAIRTTEPMENDALKYLQPDQPLIHQVSDVDPNLGFQVTSDSVCTESVSIIEKNELKIDVIDDNAKLELDVKPEMQQSPSGAVPDAGESHPMDDAGESHPTDVGELHETKDSKDNLNEKYSEEPHDKNLLMENTDGSKVQKVDCLKTIDIGDIGPPEKLSLDRSSGDDSMEEDVMESELMDDKSDSFTENVEKSGTRSEKEEDHVDVVGHDKPDEIVQHAELNIANVERYTVSTLPSGKRKFLDKEAVGNNDVVKKVRSWNSEGLKSSQPQSGSVTPKGLSEPNFKPILGTTNSMASIEAPKESVVPPPSRMLTNSLRIDRFLRPFTLKAVQELLGKTGTVTSFWMDHIKTHCYVSYSSVEEAEKTRNAVYNLQWPPNGGRLLVAEFVDPQEVKSRMEAPLASPATPSTTTPTPTQIPYAAQPSPRQQVLKQHVPPPLPPPLLSNPPHARERLHPPREQPLPSRDRLNLPPPPPLPLPEKNEPPILTLDDLFRKTKATPRIYYLPLSDELVAAKLKTQGKTVTQ